MTGLGSTDSLSHSRRGFFKHLGVLGGLLLGSRLLGDPVVDRFQDRYGATRVVAARNAIDRSRAHYRCDGQDDQEEINLALRDISATGGTVLLSEGVFSLSAPIVIRGNGVRLSGSGYGDRDGYGTLVKIAKGANSNAITFDKGSQPWSANIIIANLGLDGNYQEQTAPCHGIFVDDFVSFLLLDHMTIAYFSGSALRLEPRQMMEAVKAVNSNFVACVRETLYGRPQAEGEIYWLNFVNCHFSTNPWDPSDTIIYLDTSAAQPWKIHECIFNGCFGSYSGRHGFHLRGVRELTISGCLFRDLGRAAPDSYDGVLIEADDAGRIPQGIVINGSTFINYYASMMRFGINIQSGDRIVISGNSLKGASGAFHIAPEVTNLIKGNNLELTG